MDLTKRALAEFLGTFWLVLGGCGTALISAKVPGVGVGILGIGLAFGLTVVTGMYALGVLSGGHFNPAITLGMATAHRFPTSEVLPYWAAQVAGGILASLVLYFVAHGAPEFSAVGSGFAANGYGAHSPGGYDLGAAFLSELVMTFMFVIVVLGSTHSTAFKGFAPLAVGLTLTLIHLISIPVTNTSVNPARSTGPALFAGGWAVGQLWLFWIAPLIGAVIAGVVHPALIGDRSLDQLRAEARDLSHSRRAPAR
jgi:aquaporin Z